MIREMKKPANGNEPKWKFYKDFLVGTLMKNEFESVEIEQLIAFF